MESKVVQIDHKIKNIQSDYGSSDYENAKKFHDSMAPKLTETAKQLGVKNLPVNGEYEEMLVARYNAVYTELVSDEIAMAQEVRTCYYQVREDYYNTNEGHLNYEITRVKQEFEKAKILHGRLLGETDASVFLLKRPWMVYLVLITIGLLEYPLNMSLFRAFNLGNFGAILLSILVVVIIPILSHLNGKFVKQYKERRTNLLLGIGLGTILFLFVLFLSVFRYMYFEAQQIMALNEATFQEAFKQIKMAGSFSSTIFWVAFLLNIGLVIIGFVLGFLSHDSKDAFEKAFKEFTIRRPILINNLSEERKKQHTNFTIQKSNSLAREQNLLQKMTEFHRMHDALAQHVINFASYMDGLCKESINSFRIQNQAARSSMSSIPRNWRDGVNGYVAVTPKAIEPLFIETYTEMNHQVN